eukprot:scaffold18532_cov19-Tisochrysis_lutea.AAC.4
MDDSSSCYPSIKLQTQTAAAAGGGAAPGKVDMKEQCVEKTSCAAIDALVHAVQLNINCKNVGLRQNSTSSNEALARTEVQYRGRFPPEQRFAATERKGD